MQRTVVLNVVGLTRALWQGRDSFIARYAAENYTYNFAAEFPAVTCSAQASYLTGKTVDKHGIVGNGWYDRTYNEVFFWKQSNQLIAVDKIWHILRTENPQFSCANLFWWYNMYSAVDWSCTPRPIYRANGNKIFDIHTQPMELREKLKENLGAFPFRNFWGPQAGIQSSQWIAQAAQWLELEQQPTLQLVYLPHLDYALQQHGVDGAAAQQAFVEIDHEVEKLVGFFRQRGVQVAIVSEYGIENVQQPIHLNRLFRQQGWLSIKDEYGHERLECGQSKVFAVADHQVAHVYVNLPELRDEVRQLLLTTPGVNAVYSNEECYPESGIGSQRAGDLIVEAEQGSWFTYYYWFDDKRAPDYAKNIDIHRKIGYDPAELFIDPTIHFPLLKMAWFLLRKKCRLQTDFNMIPLDASLVGGSHGRKQQQAEHQPIWISPQKPLQDIRQPQDIFYAIHQLVTHTN